MEVKKIVEGMTAVEVAEVIDSNFKNQNKILEEDIATQNSVIGVSEYKAFSESESVNVGEVRKYDGMLYECVEATSGAWDASKWKKSSFKAETEKKLSELGQELKDLSYYTQKRVKGYIFEDGSTNKDAKASSLYLKLPCKKGDVFSYSGNCGNLAPAIFNYDNDGNLILTEAFSTKFEHINNAKYIAKNDGYILFQSVYFDESELEETSFVVSPLLESDRIYGSRGRGLLNSLGGFQDSANFVNETTDVISCKQGDVFFYEGWGQNSAVAYIFFKDEEIVSVGYVGDKSQIDVGFSVVTIPEGVNGVRFSSTSRTEPILFVYKSSVLTYFESKKEEFSKEINDLSISLENISYYTSEWIPGYFLSNGTISSKDSFKMRYALFSCNEGDIFYYRGTNGLNAVGALFYDKNGSLVSSYAERAFSTVETTIEIPRGISMVKFVSSKLNTSEDPLQEVFNVKYLDSRENEQDLLLYSAEHLGYLREDGSYHDSQGYHCKTTFKNKCKQGDIFYYKGYGVNLAKSYIMYNEGEIVSAESLNSKDILTPVTIPEGVDEIIFSSFAPIGEDVILVVVNKTKIDTLAEALDKRSDLIGKKINWLGDSYVENHSQSYTLTWEYLISQKHGMVYRNYGRNGTAIVGGNATDMDVRYLDMETDADYVMVVGGTNDFNRQTSINTFKSKLKDFFVKLITMYPSAKIAIWTPFNDDGQLNPAYTQTDNKIPLGEYAQAMEEVCQSIGLACFNSFNKANIYAWSEEFRTLYFQSPTDRAHLNEEGHKRFMSLAESFILSL